MYHKECLICSFSCDTTDIFDVGGKELCGKCGEEEKIKLTLIAVGHDWRSTLGIWLDGLTPPQMKEDKHE